MKESVEDADVLCMLRLKDGEDIALNEIIDRWQQRVANFILRFVGNESDAIDLAQETFVRVYENRHRYEPRSAFSTWLFQIATNLALSHIRWQKRHPIEPIETSDNDDQSYAHPKLASNDVSPSESLVRKERFQIVRDAIQSLPPEYRAVILLFEYEDLSYQKIATIQNTSPKAVESKLYRARQILREKLQKDFTL